MRPSCFVLASALALSGCASRQAASASAPPAASAPSAEDPRIAGLLQALERNPRHGPLHLFVANQLAQAGRKAEAVQTLEKLAAMGWPFALPASGLYEFGVLEGTPGYAAVAERFARAAPHVEKAQPAFTLQQADLVPEGITYDPASRLFLVGSIRQRKVLAVDAQGRARELVPSGAHGLQQVLGMRVDGAGRLWVASHAADPAEGAAREPEALFCFSLPDGALVKKVVLQAEGKHLLNDLAFGPGGEVYVTDSEGGGVWVLPSGGDTLKPFVPGGTWSYPNGLDVSADGKWLYVAAWDGLNRVNLQTGTHEAVEAPEGVVTAGIDGLVRHGDTLLAVQNAVGAPQVRRFRLSPDGLRITEGEVLEAGSAHLEIPTTGTVAGDRYFFIGNSSLRAKTPTPARILSLAL